MATTKSTARKRDTTEIIDPRQLRLPGIPEATIVHYPPPTKLRCTRCNRPVVQSASPDLLIGPLCLKRKLLEDDY